MRGAETTLPPEFSLLRSEFNEFLFAAIGEESNDSVLTVLSALARTGIDPWQEAARLGQLSKALATQRLTSIIAGLPNGRWEQTDSGAIAARLIDLLPAKRAIPSLSRGTAGTKYRVSPAIAKVAFVVVIGGSILFAVMSRMNPAPVIDSSSPFSTTTTAPSVPVAGSK